MKTKPLYVTAILLAITVILTSFTMLTSSKETGRGHLNVTASFYPIYIAALNITQGIDSTELNSLSQPSTGCLHDYQLTPEDMITLEKTDLFLINGGGMEGYLDHVTASMPNLNIVDTSAGVSMLPSSEGHVHEEIHSHEEQESEAWNAHIWMDPERYSAIIDNIAKALAQADPANERQYYENAKEYQNKIAVLFEPAKELFSGKNIHSITFHESLDYLCEYLDLHVVHGTTIEAETSLSAAEISEIIEEAKEENVTILLADMQYSLSVPSAVSKETKIPYLALDSCVTGDGTAYSYLTAMKNNLTALKEVLGNGK